MSFELVDDIQQIEVIATGGSVRDRASLKEQYGGSRWRKLKGIAQVRLLNGRIRWAEVHWYEAHGIGRRRIKIKRFVEPTS